LEEVPALEERLSRLREEMVKVQLAGRGIQDPRVLRAMRSVQRHRFVPAELIDRAYEDGPLPLGFGQTISQPYIVAFMSESLGLAGPERVLEIGTGSGYQTAILAELAHEVFTVECLADLAQDARRRLGELGYSSIRFATGDGTRGWAEVAPFDAILVAAAAERVPPALLDQLAPGARLILPLGIDNQDLWMFTRTDEGPTSRRLLPVRFVPLVHG
jgi:protein-L-isoaspartate(D-aspartate) O-methyltransferase